MKKRARRITPIKTVLFFACMGGFWLFASLCMVLTNFVLERNALHAIEISEVVFILISSWLLYYLITKSRHDSFMDGNQPMRRLVRSLKAYSECHQALIRAVFVV